MNWNVAKVFTCGSHFGIFIFFRTQEWRMWMSWKCRKIINRLKYPKSVARLPNEKKIVLRLMWLLRQMQKTSFHCFSFIAKMSCNPLALVIQVAYELMTITCAHDCYRCLDGHFAICSVDWRLLRILNLRLHNRLHHRRRRWTTSICSALQLPAVLNLLDQS